MSPAAPRRDNPFHAGEQALQERVGLREQMLEVGRRVIRTAMPEQHQRFFEQLPFMLAGSVDAQGRPWASVLVGPPGFVQAASATRLDFRAQAVAGDPLGAALQPGAPLGLLGIELHTRRRNRVNGHVVARSEQGFSVQVDLSVGNCPQYIQGREFRWVRDAADLQPTAIESMPVLDAEAQALVARADTLFVATQAPPVAGVPDSASGRGADVSHRGGRPGFVRVEDERTLLVPDFAGNSFFMTLGNLQLDPRAGVLFIDFDSGELLTLSGRAEVVWDAEDLAAFEGAERAWRFHVEAGWRLREALPLRWSFRELSPHAERTGTWAQAAAHRRAAEVAPLAQRWRPWRVRRLVDESSVIRSFHLEPADGLGLPDFQAGQHLPIRLRTADGVELRRTYTVSLAPGEGELRLSVKREGVASRHLHEHVRAGDTIEALGPRGQFTVDATDPRPAVLIGAGVGITPMVAFARHLVAEGRRQTPRPLHLVQVARNEDQRAFGAELQALQQQSGGAMQLHRVLDDLAGAPPGTWRGPLDMALLKRLLPFDDHEFFLCGPPGFMQALYDGLRALGVRDERIRAEAFGPASLQRRPDLASEPAAPPAPAATQAPVRFVRSDRMVTWTPGAGSLLELAEAEGLDPPFSCRAGHCGSCSTRMKAGQVTYAQAPDWKAAPGEVLLCQARPAAGGAEPLELDL